MRGPVPSAEKRIREPYGELPASLETDKPGIPGTAINPSGTQKRAEHGRCDSGKQKNNTAGGNISDRDRNNNPHRHHSGSISPDPLAAESAADHQDTGNHRTGNSMDHGRGILDFWMKGEMLWED